MAQKIGAYIGTPTTKQLVHSGYSISLARIAATLAMNGCNVTIKHAEGYDVSQQRDELATDFLEGTNTHLLFCDDDIEIEPQIALELLSLNNPVSGVICPWRRFDVPKIAQWVKAGHSSADALDLSHTFNVSGVKFPPIGPLLECEKIGAGFLLISREAFARLMSETEVKEYKTHPDKKIVKQFFHRIKTADGEMMPEDWSFCQRWRDIGGRVFGHAHANVVHSGYYQHRAQFAQLLKSVSDAAAAGTPIK